MIKTEDTCVICGAVIPEGKQYCPMCGSDVFGRFMGGKTDAPQPESPDFTIKDEIEQAYRQGYAAGASHAQDVKRENNRLRREIALLRSTLEHRNNYDIDDEYE